MLTWVGGDFIIPVISYISIPFSSRVTPFKGVVKVPNPGQTFKELIVGEHVRAKDGASVDDVEGSSEQTFQGVYFGLTILIFFPKKVDPLEPWNTFYKLCDYNLLYEHLIEHSYDLSMHLPYKMVPFLNCKCVPLDT